MQRDVHSTEPWRIWLTMSCIDSSYHEPDCFPVCYKASTESPSGSRETSSIIRTSPPRRAPSRPVTTFRSDLLFRDDVLFTWRALITQSQLLINNVTGTSPYLYLFIDVFPNTNRNFIVFKQVR